MIPDLISVFIAQEVDTRGFWHGKLYFISSSQRQTHIDIMNGRHSNSPYLPQSEKNSISKNPSPITCQVLSDQLSMPRKWQHACNMYVTCMLHIYHVHACHMQDMHVNTHLQGSGLLFLCPRKGTPSSSSDNSFSLLLLLFSPSPSSGPAPPPGWLTSPGHHPTCSILTITASC